MTQQPHPGGLQRVSVEHETQTRSVGRRKHYPPQLCGMMGVRGLTAKCVASPLGAAQRRVNKASRVSRWTEHLMLCKAVTAQAWAVAPGIERTGCWVSVSHTRCAGRVTSAKRMMTGSPAKQHADVVLMPPACLASAIICCSQRRRRSREFQGKDPS